MRKVLDTKRLLLTGALVFALALVAGLWAQNQIASAQVAPSNVILVHVNPDGSDYLGNPYCPDGGQPEIIEPDGVDDDDSGDVDLDGDTDPDEGEQDIVDRALDDCNNVMGQEHVIRTRGWDPAFGNPVWTLSNGPAEDPANAQIMAEGDCGAIAEVIGRPNWDPDDDGGAQVPPLGDKDDEQCVVIKSTLPGETVVHLTFDDGGDDGGAVQYTTDPIVKEWDSIIDTVILRDEPVDEDGDTDIDAADHHLADLQGTEEDQPVVFDEALKRIRAPIPIQIIEIVHGGHVGQANGAPGVQLNHPTEGAIITATIDSPRGCTYFTNPILEYDTDDDGTVDVTIPFEEFNFGDTVTGVSDWDGRFVGPLTNNGGQRVLDPVTSLPWDIKDLWLDTICEEQATVIITVDYPEAIASSPDLPDPEEITINWTTVELAKQPQLRWAGEEIVLAKRWALPDDYFPNLLPDGSFADLCPNAFKIVRVNRLTTSTAGDLIAGIPEVFEPFNNVDQIWTIVDPLCVSRVIATSEDQGEGDFEATLHSWELELGPGSGDHNDDFLDDLQGVLDDLNVAFLAGDISKENVLTEMGWEFQDIVDTAEFYTDPDQYNLGELENKHAWLVWWLKIYQVKLDNILLDADGTGRADHNAGTWAGEDPATSAGADAETLNVSQDALLRVTVKGWFRGGDQSARGAVCIDMDGDGDGDDATTTDIPGVPYPLTQYELGCPDADDEILDHGAWVLPDDMAKLAGPQPDRIATWDVMHDIDEAASNVTLVGPKSSLDSHDPVGEPVARDWVPCVDSVLDADLIGAPTGVPDGGENICPRKTIDPDGEITVADALMPPLKIRATIPNDDDGVAEAGEAGFLKEAMKADDVGIDSAYQSIMIPADPDIPPIVNNGGYDWDSWACRLPWFNSKLQEFPDDWFGVDADDDPEIADICDTDIQGVWGLEQGPYDFYQELTKLTIDGMPVDMQFYTDNRGQGFFFANGDYNLTYDDCPADELTGTPVCDVGDVVGTTDITVIGDYPYFRKHSAILSNPVEKTWVWDGFKRVTAETIDLNHTAIIAHLKDRDGFCKFSVTAGDPTSVVYSPSLEPVEGEEIEFILNNKGVASIIGVSPNGVFSAPQTPLGEAIVLDSEDGVIVNLNDAVALAEDVRVLDDMVANGLSPVGFGARDPIEDDECQAWIVVEHPADVAPDVSIIFNDPEGQVTRHWPPKGRTVRLVEFWNDACYTGLTMPIEEAMAAFIDNVLAVYRYDHEAEDWDRWFPEAPEGVNTITDVAPYDQLLILTDASADWEMEITNPPADVDLITNWNSVCYAGASKSPEDATESILGDFQIIYTLGTDQGWRRFVPDRADLNTLGATLDQFTSVLILVTAEDGTTWVFDP